MKLPIQVEALLFKRERKRLEYLLLKRIPERGEFWQPVTGGVETGESLEEALKREIKEETGIKDTLRIIKDLHYFEFSDPQLMKEYVFGVEVPWTVGVTLSKREHSLFQWCSFEKAVALMKWEENKKALEKLNNFLSAEGRWGSILDTSLLGKKTL